MMLLLCVRQLELHTSSVQYTASSYYGLVLGRSDMDNVQCTGTEERLQDCPFKGWGQNDCGNTHEHDAGVQCKGIFFSIFVL